MRCEDYYTEEELVDGNCPNHGTPVSFMAQAMIDRMAPGAAIAYSGLMAFVLAYVLIYVFSIDIAWWWVLASLGLNLVSILLKAVVWKAALDTIPDRPRFHYLHVVPAVFIGLLLNTLLPARLGEIGRVSVLRRRLHIVGTDVPSATLAGSLVAEQIVLRIALGRLSRRVTVRPAAAAAIAPVARRWR